MRNEALNTLGAEQIALQIKQALIVALPRIIEASVKPIEKIDGIKIVQVDGLNRGGANGASAAPAVGGGNLAEQAVSAALAYRAQQPILDAVLAEIGLKGGSLNGLVEGVKSEFAAAPAAETPAIANAEPDIVAPAPQIVVRTAAHTAGQDDKKR